MKKQYNLTAKNNESKYLLTNIFKRDIFVLYVVYLNGLVSNDLNCTESAENAESGIF